MRDIDLDSVPSAPISESSTYPPPSGTTVIASTILGTVVASLRARPAVVRAAASSVKAPILVTPLDTCPAVAGVVVAQLVFLSRRRLACTGRHPLPRAEAVLGLQHGLRNHVVSLRREMDVVWAPDPMQILH